MLVFRKILRMHLMHHPISFCRLGTRKEEDIVKQVLLTETMIFFCAACLLPLINEFRVSDTINEIFVWGCKLDFGAA